ncbi:MAG: hypothetical protein ACPLZH_00490 [Minisyncoccales bacterium]
MNKKVSSLFFFLYLFFSLLFFPYHYAQSQDPLATLLGFLNTIYIFVIRLTIVLAILKIIWGGITYLFSVGEITSVAEAKETIVDAFLGLVVALTAYSFLGMLGLRAP